MNPTFMRRALELAGKGVGATSPNPAVGAVIVRDGEMVGEGFHTWEGVKHAEILAIEQAGAKARGATLYVSLEPCAHQGRTGPCADAVAAAGITHVVAAMQDPNPRVSGEGFRRLSGSGIEVELAREFTHEAERINQSFVHYHRTGRPLVTLKAALTLDGKIAAPEDNTGWITSDRARRHVQQVRHVHDSILTGIGTLLSDDCRLTDRTGLPRSRPLLRIVVDSQLRIPMDSTIVRTVNGDVLVATTSAASAERKLQLESRGVQVLAFDGPYGRVDLMLLTQWLAREKYLSLMIEAGSKINWSALAQKVVDRIFFYYAPKIFGGMKSLPVAGGPGVLRRVDAMTFRQVRIHQITEDEFAVEAWLIKE